MAIKYGVLRGHPDRFKREDNESSPHLQIRVLENSGQPWRIAVNVESDTGSDVVFWVVDPLTNHPLLASLPVCLPASARWLETPTTPSILSKLRCLIFRAAGCRHPQGTSAVMTCKTFCRCSQISPFQTLR